MYVPLTLKGLRILCKYTDHIYDPTFTERSK